MVLLHHAELIQSQNLCDLEAETRERKTFLVGQRDRREDRDRRKDRKTNGRTKGQMGRQRDKWEDNGTNGKTKGQTGRQRDKREDKGTYGKTRDRRENKKTGRRIRRRTGRQRDNSPSALSPKPRPWHLTPFPSTLRHLNPCLGTPHPHHPPRHLSLLINFPYLHPPV